MVQRTKNDTYLLTEREVVEFGKRLKKKLNYSPSLALDIANLIEGGEILPTPDIKSQIRKQLSKQLTLKADASGQYRDVKGEKVPSYADAMDSYVDEHFKVQKNTVEFLQELKSGGDLNKVPGRTPLEKTFTLLRMLDKNDGKSSSPMPTGGGGGGEFMPTFSGGNSRGSASARNLHDQLEFLDKITPESKELMSTLENDMYDDGTEEDEDTQNAISIASNVYREILKSASMLDRVTAIHTKPTSRLIPDVTGDRIEHRAIRGFEETGKIHAKEFIRPRPVMLSRIIEHQTQVKQIYRQEQSMPIIALLIDDSGSMNENYKREKALGILHNMLERVMKSETWLLFSFFEKQAHKFYTFEAGDVEAVKKFYRGAVKHKFDTGGTYVGGAAQRALEELDKIYDKYTEIDFSRRDRHLILVNDGQDDASNLTLQMLNGAKLHAFVLDSDNEELRRLAIQSGGSYRSKL
jgi:hypothetical protein